MIQLISGIQNTSAALDAEQTRLDVISQNIANVNTTHGLDGKPYQRQVVVFESALQQALNQDGSLQMSPIQVARVEKDSKPAIQIYDPGNPDADGKGMVSMPNINMDEEMADLISASRAYEANLAVAKNSHSMAMETLSMGKV